MTAISFQITGVASTMARIKSATVRVSVALNRAVARRAMALKKEIQTGLRNQAPGGKAIRPLAPMTIALRKIPAKGSTKRKRGSSKALIDSGTMIQSVNVDKIQDGAYFVGINRTARAKDGRELADLAEIHEFGGPAFSYVVTPKVRAFFFALYKLGLTSGPLPRYKKRINHPGIPPRPFLTPAYNAWKKTAAKEFAQDMGRMIGL